MLTPIKNLPQYVENFTDVFSYVTPGEAKGFSSEELAATIAWVV